MKQLFPHTDKNLSKEIKEAFFEDFKSADKKMLYISLFSFLGTSLITSYSHDTYFLGIVGGGIALLISIIAYAFYKGTLISRLLFGIVFMIYPSIMLQQQLGMIEMHFAFFYMVSFLMMYKDISSILIAAFVVTIHHIALTYLQLNNIEVMGTPLLIFGPNCSWTITLIHMVMWAFALFVYMYIIIKSSQRFIGIRVTNEKLLKQAEEVERLNRTLEKKVSLRTFELSEQKDVFQSLFNDSSDAISLIKDGVFIDCNNATLRMLKYKAKENFAHLKPYQLSPKFQPDGQKSDEKSKKLVEKCINDGSERFEWVHTKSTGENFWVDVVLTKIKIKNEDIIHVVWRDITNKKHLDELLIHKTEALEESNEELTTSLENLKQTQEKLVESEKMASLNTLVTGVAHEINTPIGVGITGITHFIEITKNLKIDYESNTMSEEAFEKYLKTSTTLADMVNNNLQRTSRLVTSFKQIASDQISEKRRNFDLIEYLDSLIFSIENEIKNKEININVISDPVMILNSYPGIFSLVFSNLIFNSIYHAFDKNTHGKISIEIIKGSQELKIIYKDNGKGIPEENLVEVFEPFFTTGREQGKIGLGLNILYNSLTTKLRGTVNIASKEGNGVVFTILIPREEINETT